MPEVSLSAEKVKKQGIAATHVRVHLDPAAPTFIKIYDPHNTGSSCGSGPVPIPPRWILSRIQPTLIADDYLRAAEEILTAEGLP